MDPKPIEHSRPPAYPTRREVLGGAASLVLIKLTGASAFAAEAEVGGVNVAPIFAHGEGRGVTGCVVVSPPAFLSEEEALQVVREELAKHGVRLASGPVLKDLPIAPRHKRQIREDEKSEKTVQDESGAAPIRITGMDETRSIAIEFICLENYKKLGGVDSHSAEIVDRDGHKRGFRLSSVQEYDFQDAAQYVATEIRRKAQQRLYVGVFYDPMSRTLRLRKVRKSSEDPAQTPADPQSARKQARDDAAAESRKLLRQQAQDFVVWLKEQKAIE